MISKTQALLLALCLLMWGSASAGSSGGLALTASLTKEGQVVVTARNFSDQPQWVWKDVALSGRGGGNLVLIVVSELGQIVAPCTFLDSPRTKSKQVLHSSNSAVLWSGSEGMIARLFCLEPGVYKVAAGYLPPGGGMLFSEPLELRVD